jgi:hypothetical protein
VSAVLHTCSRQKPELSQPFTHTSPSSILTAFDVPA